jgi:WD40 repeat protein
LADHRLPSRQGSESSLSWSSGGLFVARAVGYSVVIAEASQDFREVASFDLQQMVQRVVFCRAQDKQDLIAVAGVDGHLMVLRLKDEEPNKVLEKMHSVFVKANLKGLAWSPDGTLLAVGGKDQLLHVFSASDMKEKIKPVDLGARIWDIHFMPQTVPLDSSFIAVALGDYDRHHCHLCRERLGTSDSILSSSIAIDSQVCSASNQTTHYIHNAHDNNALVHGCVNDTSHILDFSALRHDNNARL